MEQQKPNRVALGVVEMKSGQYGQYMTGRLGMAQIRISPTKKDPNKWLITVVEQPQGENRGYQQKPQQRPTPPQRQYAPSGPIDDGSPFPDQDDF